MKIRTGFVSNSSTSSYIVCGWKYPYPETVEEMIKVILKIDASCINPDDYIEKDDIDLLDEILDDLSCGDNNVLGLKGEQTGEESRRGLYFGNITATYTDISIQEETVEKWMQFLKPFPPGIDEEIESHFPKVYKIAPEW